MNSLVNKIRSWFQKPASIDCSDIDFQQLKKVYEIKHGNSFRGHTSHMYTTNGDNPTIQYCNSYFKGHVQATFFINANKTVVKFHKWWKTPKYIINALGNDCYAEHKDVWEDGDRTIKVVIHQNEMHIDVHKTYKGIHFLDHYQNINRMKTLDEMMRYVKCSIKNDPDGFLIPNGDHGYKLKL